jgi:hypothetical protein
MRIALSLLLFICCAFSVTTAAVAQGAYSGTTAVPASGNTMTLSQPVNGQGTGTIATSLTISSATKTYKKDVDYTVTGLPGQTPVVEWLPGKRPAAGTSLTLAGSTDAQGTFTTEVTWS